MAAPTRALHMPSPGMRTSTPVWPSGATPSRHAISGQSHSYTAAPLQGQTHSYVAPPLQGHPGSYVPPQIAQPVEVLPQACMPAQNNPAPRGYRRPMSPPPPHMVVQSQTLQASPSVGRLEAGQPLQSTRRPHLTASAEPYSRPPPTTYETVAPAFGSSGGYQDALQQEFREQRHHGSSGSKTSRSPAQETREVRKIPSREVQPQPERMRSARVSYGHENDIRVQLADKDNEIARKDSEIARMKKEKEKYEISARKEEEHQRKHDYREKYREVKERERHLEERERAMRERENAAASRQDRIEERERKVVERETWMAEREADTKCREAKLSERESKLADREAEVIKNCQEIESMRFELDDREARLEHVQDELDERKKALDEEEERFRARERQHMEALRDAQVFRSKGRPSPRNKENIELAKQLEEQREAAHGIKLQGWKQQKPEAVEARLLSPVAGTGEMVSGR